MNWILDLKIKNKLIISFAIVIIFSVVLAVLAVTSINNLNSSYTYLFDFPQMRATYLTHIDTDCAVMRQATTAMAININNKEKITSYWDQFEKAYNDASDNIEKYLESNNTDTVKDAASLREGTESIMRVRSLLAEYRENTRIAMETAIETGDINVANPIFLAGADVVNESVAIVSEWRDKVAEYTESVSISNTNEKDMAILESYITLGVIIVISAVIALYISSLISKPIILLSTFMQNAGTTGNIALRPDDIKNIEQHSKHKDEISLCINYTAGFVKHVLMISDKLSKVAEGDLSDTIKTLSDQDMLGVTVQKMIENLNNMFTDINSSTAQVSAGAKQVADGSQSLAQGSTEQASAVEELSSSIADIATQTKANAEMAGRAASLADKIKNNAEKGSKQMDEMISAVKEINQSSHNINKIMKVIDEIAFQTNILALNAAVEAARAGSVGKGFAVVAEEVGNLAAKSAQAAKDTGDLIQSSIERAELGARIADETAASLEEIVSGINESSQLVRDIAHSSEAQSEGVAQVNKGIAQVAQVIQVNSATAEESASASQEMSGQAGMLEELVLQFKLKDSNASSQSYARR